MDNIGQHRDKIGKHFKQQRPVGEIYTLAMAEDVPLSSVILQGVLSVLPPVWFSPFITGIGFPPYNSFYSKGKYNPFLFFILIL
jgi:hypothetical protein